MKRILAISVLMLVTGVVIRVIIEIICLFRGIAQIEMAMMEELQRIEQAVTE